MLSARLCQVASSKPYVQSLPTLKLAFTLRINFAKPKHLINNNVRYFVDRSRGRVSHIAARKTLAEQALSPASGTAISIGKGALGGSALVGLGALCYYGLGLSSEAGTLEKTILWPQYVKDRIRSTYMYFGGSFAISVASAAAVFSNPRLLNFVCKGGILPVVISMAAVLGSTLLVRKIPYSPGLGAKQLAWMGNSALIGAILAPLAFVGSPILLRAAWYTAGIAGGLSCLAVCAPSEKFLNLGGPLAIGLGVIVASTFGSMLLPQTTALGSGLYSLSLYGGLLLFSGFLLYDTQRIIKVAEKYPPDYASSQPYDPINMSLSIYMDVINIFINITSILANGRGNRK